MLNEALTRDLMHWVAVGDWPNARRVCLTLCAKETTEKHKKFREDIVERIKNRPNFMDLPMNVKGLLYTEDIGVKFDEGLYYISDREMELVQRLKVMQNTTEALNQVGITYRNAALLFGPSGSGKTAFAKFLAKEMGRDFFMANLSGIVDAYMGGTSKNLARVFETVADAGPNALLFLDELDAISANRDAKTFGQNGADKELSRATMVMMQQLDMLPRETVLIAATNHIEFLDKAIRRRFPVEHKFESFNVEEREMMVRKYLATIKERAASGAFKITWDDAAVRQFAEDSLKQPQANVIELVVQAIADMLDDGKTTIEFPTKAVIASVTAS